MSGTEIPTANVAEALAPYLVRISDLAPDPTNGRKGDVAALKASLLRFGQVRAITVDKGNQIVAGHHLVLAAEELGWTHIAAIPVEFENEEEQRLYLIADNQLAQLGGYKEQQIDQMNLLEEIIGRGGSIEGTGFDIDRIEDAKAKLGAVPTTETPETWGGSYAETEGEHALRAQKLAQSQKKKEVGPYMVSLDEFQEFADLLRALTSEYKTSGTFATIMKALRNEVERLIPFEAPGTAAATDDDGLPFDAASVASEDPEPPVWSEGA